MSRMPGSLRAAAVAAVALLTSVAFAQTNTAGATGAPPSAGAAPQCGQVRADIAKLRTDARAQIRDLLTPEQQAQFDALPVLQGPPGRHGMGKAFGQCAGGPKGGALGAARGEKTPSQFLDHLTQKLNLTDAQKASIQPILDQARTVKQARREQARTAFRALLTPEQAAKLDALKAQPGPGQFGHRGELQLTDEQKAKADEIFAQLRTDMKQMRDNTRQQIRAQLTPDQQTQFDALHPGAGEAGRWGGKHGMHGGPALRNPGMVLDRLSSELSLTDAQRASVKTIMDNLHTAIRERIQEARPAAGAPASS